MIAFTGLPGTGKSTLAERVATTLGAPAFAADWLMGALKPYRVLSGLDRESYLSVSRDLLSTLATRQLMFGQSAILDCLADGDTVARWQELTARFDARLVVIQCECSDVGIHQRRIVGRQRGIPGWHEVDWEHVERMRIEFPPLSGQHFTLDTAVGDVDDNVATALRHINSHAGT